MDNYKISKERAREYFLKQDRSQLIRLPIVRRDADCLCFRFVGGDYRLDPEGFLFGSDNGFQTTWEADYSEALSIYDRLCDGKPDAALSGQYCTVHSLPGVYVGGDGGLTMGGGSLPGLIEANLESFSAACLSLDGREIPMGDLAYEIKVFSDLPMILKFYRSDEDFPAQLVFLWDRNMLDFVKYETVYYIAGHICKRLKQKMDLPVGKPRG